MNVKVNGLEMFVEIKGSGPPLVVLHGFTGSSENWKPFFSSWSRRFRVIALDLIGHGRTAAPADPSRYTMDHAAYDLAELLDQLDVPAAHVLGYSMGGRLALTFAVRYPDRVRGLMLESSSPGLQEEQARKERMVHDEALADRIESRGVQAFVEEWEKIPLFATQSETARRKLQKQRLKNRGAGLAGSLRGMGTGSQESMWEKLETLPMPVKLVVGELDKKFRRIAEEMQKKLPNAEIITVRDAGHAIHVEQSRFFDKIVEEWININ